MKIILNGQAQETSATTLAELLQEQEFGRKVATACNGMFVPSGARAKTPLSAGDQIEVLAPMQGG